MSYESRNARRQSTASSSRRLRCACHGAVWVMRFSLAMNTSPKVAGSWRVESLQDKAGDWWEIASVKTNFRNA